MRHSFSSIGAACDSPGCTARQSFRLRASMSRISPIRNDIRRLRFEAEEMTQQGLAERIGVTRQTVNAIEGGKYSPSLEVAFRIAHVFGVSLDEVFVYYPEDDDELTGG